MHIVRTALALAVGFSLAGAARAGEAADKSVLPHFTLDSVASAAKQAGLASQVINAESIGLTATDGVKIVASLKACQQPNQTSCRGLLLFVNFKGSITPERMNTFGSNHLFASVVAQGPDHVLLVRYEIADFGIPFGNLVSNITSVLEVGRMLRRCIETDECG